MMELKSLSTGFDYTKLFTALDELKESIKQRITEENTEFSEDKSAYVADS